MNVGYHWKTSMNVGALVTLVAAVHYFYMREFWVLIHGSPILYRYIDWSITVPLQMIEFYLILSAVQPNLGGAMFWRLMLGTVWMLAWGYMGESGTMYGIMGPGIGCFVAFCLGMSGWFYILAEIFSGEAGQIAASGSVNKHVAASFKTMRFSSPSAGRSTRSATSSGTCAVPWRAPLSTWCTTLLTSSTRSPSAWPSGTLPGTAPWSGAGIRFPPGNVKTLALAWLHC